MQYIPYNEAEFAAYNLIMIHNKPYEFYRDLTIYYQDEFEFILNSKEVTFFIYTYIYIIKLYINIFYL